MKIALVHELLTMRGGAEKVLRILADMFPDAPIYTLLYDEKKLGDWFPKERIKTSPIQKLADRFAFNHHLYLNTFASAAESWDFSNYDLVISSSSAFAHGIITNGKPRHLCYVHSPARYLWDRTHDVVNGASKGCLGWLKRRYLERTFHNLRTWDTESAERPDMLLAASKIVQRRIELYWRKESDVLYPPVDDTWFERAVSGERSAVSSSYVVLVSSLVRYKRIDLAILACNQLKRHLKIVGEGPDRKHLERLAGPTIEFCGFVTNDKLKDLYANAAATIFPGDEDFGLVPLESMACGTPVIAFRSGGALETVIEEETGEFFDKPTSESLQEALMKFEQKKYSEESCRHRAKEFSRAKFEAGLQTAIKAVMAEAL